MGSSSARVVVVMPSSSSRGASLWLECAKRFPDLVILAPEAKGGSDWPTGAPVHFLPAIGGEEQTIQWIPRLGKELRRLRPQLVHVHCEPWGTVVESVARTGIPYSIHAAENVWWSAPRQNRIRRFRAPHLMSGASGYVNWGQTGLAEFSGVGLRPGTPVETIPAYPPDPGSFPRSPLGMADGPLRVAMVTRMVDAKGVADLLRAVSEPALRSEVTLRLVGDGPDLGEFKQLGQRLNVSVEFLGWGDAEAVHRVLQWSEIAAMPSRSSKLNTEQWGRSAVEAMLTGRAVLASDSGELPNLIANSALIHQQGNWQSLAQRILWVLEHRSSLGALGGAAWQRAQEFTPESLAPRMIAFWEAAIACAQGSNRSNEGRLTH